MKDEFDGARGGLLELAPGRDVVGRDVHIIEIHQPIDGRIIELVVEHGPAPVFDGVLDAGDDEDGDEGRGVEAGVGGAKDGEDLDGGGQRD